MSALTRSRGPSHAALLRTWFVLLPPIAGCHATADLPEKSFDVERAPTFSPAALVQDGAVIAAMVSADPGRLAEESSPDGLASALRARLLEERPGMRVLSPGHLELALGEERYRAFAASFGQTGDLQSTDLTEILRCLQDAVRYLLVGRLEEDAVASGENEDHTFFTTRTTKMLFAIHDLHTTSVVWKGHFRVSIQTSCAGPDYEEEDEFEHDDDDSIWEGLGKLALNDLTATRKEDEPPEPASIQEQTRRIYEAFVESLFAAAPPGDPSPVASSTSR